MKAVCVRCEVELRPEENGVVVAELYHNNQKLYKLWEADMWKCPLCDYLIVMGFAQMPFAVSHAGDIEKEFEKCTLNKRTIIYDKEI